MRLGALLAVAALVVTGVAAWIVRLLTEPFWKDTR